MSYQVLRNIPESKYKHFLEKLDKIEDTNKKRIAQEAFSRYYEANIPVVYWRLEMERDFNGDKSLLEFYKTTTEDIKKTYINGKYVCLAGSFGRGKTMTCCNILKRAVEKSYSGLYTTLSDIVSATQSNDAYIARKELLNTEFLIIDEFDSRHIANTDKSNSFFGRVLEDVLRWRTQNQMPLFLCTNSPNPLETFNGSVRDSISSLWNYVEMIPVLGKDYRTEKLSDR